MLLFAAGLPGMEADPRKDDPTAKIFLLSIADTNAKTCADAFRLGGGEITGLFRANVPEKQLRIVELQGGQVSREKILAEVRGLGEKGLVAGRDILVVFYNGHGAYDLQASDHVIATSGGWIYIRRDLEAAVEQVRPRATLIFTDGCAVLFAGQIPQEASEATAGGKSQPDKLPPLVPPQVPPVFESLFFDLPPGVMVISAAKKSQSSVDLGDTAGIFTFSLCGVIKSHLGQRLQWDEVLGMVNGRVKNLHPDATHQTAYIVGRGGSDDPPPRFGVIAQETELGRNWHGVEVTQLLNGYPHQSMRRPGDDKSYALVAGRDIIQQVNGAGVSNFAEFANAVGNSPKRMRVTVYDSKSGDTNKYLVTLRND